MSGVGSILTELPFLSSLALKSLVVFFLAGFTLFALRRASASARHLVCLLTLATLLALPCLSLALPGWRLPVALPGEPTLLQEPTPAHKFATPPETGGGRGLEGEPPLATGLTSSSSRSGRTPVTEERGNKKVGSVNRVAVSPRLLSWAILLPALWLLGFCVSLLRPLLGLWGIACLSRMSRLVSDGLLLNAVSECASALNLTRKPLLRQADAPIPMTWGDRQPVILLPAEAQTWPQDRLHAVLLHEMAHIHRRDWLSHRFTDLVCALYWFHPLVWLTARRLRAESEIACDDLVLTSGITAPDYARHLLAVARALRPASADVPHTAIAMARTARIESRLKMILDSTHNRCAPSRRTLLLALGLSATTLFTLAMLRPAAKAQEMNAVPSAANDPNSAKPGPLVKIAGITEGKASGSHWNDQGGNQWWDESGILLPRPVYNAHDHHFAEMNLSPRERMVLVAFHLTAALEAATFAYDFAQSSSTSSSGQWPGKMSHQENWTEARLNARTNGTRVVAASFPKSLAKTSFRVGVASGPWTTVVTDSGGSMSTGRQNETFLFSPAIETKDGLVLTVTTEGVKDDVRIVAVNKKGNELLPSSIGDSSSGSISQITGHFALPLSQIKEFRVETRPFQWTDFKDVALHPVK
jgi:beta-lactamase regulating signal transducer with metallopeptidase domain